MASDVVFVPDPLSWEKEFRSYSGIVGKHMIKVMMRATLAARRSAPGPGKRPRNRTKINYATGVLEKSIVPRRARWGNEIEVRVIALPKHALWVHEGTRPHVIVPKRSTHLVFFWPKAGKTVFLKKVNHPGTRRTPFLAENLRYAIR